MRTYDAARAAIRDACATARSLPDVFAGVATGLAHAVPADAYCLNGLDPTTLQETFARHSVRLAPAAVTRFFEIEAAGTDVNAVAALARSPIGAATLRTATEGDPARSARYRDVLRPAGIADELRVVLRDRRVPWGVVNLFRGPDSPDFSTAEVRFVASLGRTVADGIRRTLVLGAADTRNAGVGPGVLIVDLAQPEHVHHRSPAARRWLGELDDADWNVTRVVRQAQAAGRPAQIMVCSQQGRWLTLHAEPSDDARASVVIEPTRPADLARLVLEAYGLSEREREIARLLTYGHTNTAISRQLGLSRHTVGDHIKNVFTKLSVHSRAELATRLFAPAPTDGPPATHPRPAPTISANARTPVTLR